MMNHEVINVTTTVDPTVDPNNETGVTPSIDIDAMLARRAEYERLLNAAAASLTEAAKYGEADFELRGVGRYRGGRYFPKADGIEELLRRFDATHWRELLSSSGLRSFLDATARASWTKSLEEGTAPELTRDNIAATFSLLHEQRGEMFERGVIELFRKLSHDYKTNTPVKLGKRLVITYAVSSWGDGGPEGRFADQIDDLIRVMSVLDGKPEPDHRQCAHYAIPRTWPRAVNDVELHGFVSLRGFKNRNCHLLFLRPDLVDKMNRIIARHFPNALPPAT